MRSWKTLEGRQNSRLLMLMFIAFYAIAAVIDSGMDITAGKAVIVLMSCFAVLVLFVTADFGRLDVIFGFSLLYGAWLFIVLVYSLLIWIFELRTASYIMRGCFKAVYQFLVIFNIAASAYLFGEKAIDYTFWGFALGNLGIMILQLPKYGIGGAVSSIVTVVTTLGETTVGYMRSLEIHDLTFTFGFFLLYFMFFDEDSSKSYRVIKFIVAAFFFFIGFKRVAIASFFVFAIVGFVLMRMPTRAQTSLMKVFLIGAVGFAFVYLFSIKTSFFINLLNEFGIDVKGRDTVYDAIDSYWQLTPTYIGHGFEYITIMLMEIAESGNKAFNNMIALHNDFIRVYIEMGFFGFIVWLGYTLLYQFRWIRTKFVDSKTLCLFFLCEMYIFFTYLTDNTLFYYYTGMVLRMMPMCYVMRNSRLRLTNLIVVNDEKRSIFELIAGGQDRSEVLYRKKY